MAVDAPRPGLMGIAERVLDALEANVPDPAFRIGGRPSNGASRTSARGASDAADLGGALDPAGRKSGAGDAVHALCFNTMNRSAYLLGDEDPDLPGQIAAAGAVGFAGFGPDAFSIARFVEDGGSVEALAEQIVAAGMRTFELPTLMVSSDTKGTQVEIARLVEYAKVLRPAFVQLNVEGDVDDGVIDGLRRAGDAFGAQGARLAIEYLPWLPAIRDIVSTRDLLDRAGVDRAGVLVDTWHFAESGDTWADLEALPLDELAYVQFDDHPPRESDDLVRETLMRRAMPGEGRFELERFCEVIKAKGYTGPVSCEILSAETRAMDLDVFARRVFESTAPYWQ